jgi:hypothetical protein
VIDLSSGKDAPKRPLLGHSGTRVVEILSPEIELQLVRVAHGTTAIIIATTAPLATSPAGAGLQCVRPRNSRTGRATDSTVTSSGGLAGPVGCVDDPVGANLGGVTHGRYRGRSRERRRGPVEGPHERAAVRSCCARLALELQRRGGHLRPVASCDALQGGDQQTATATADGQPCLRPTPPTKSGQSIEPTPTRHQKPLPDQPSPPQDHTPFSPNLAVLRYDPKRIADGDDSHARCRPHRSAPHRGGYSIRRRPQCAHRRSCNPSAGITRGDQTLVDPVIRTQNVQQVERDSHRTAWTNSTTARPLRQTGRSWHRFPGGSTSLAAGNR